MIRSVGLGWAFRILAIVSAAVNTICTILIRDRNKAVGSVYDAFDYALLKRPEFVLTLLWGSFSIIGYICMLFSLPNYAVSIGLDASQASIVGAMLNLGQGIGRPLIGYFSDSLGRINMCLLCTAFCGVTIFAIWIPATSYGVLILFALLGGAVAGTIWTTVGPVTAEVIGLKDLPSALSLFWTSLILPSAFSEVMALELKRAPPANVYLHAQILTGMMFVGATFCLWFVRAWKINELDKAEEAEAAAGRTLDEKRREQEIRDDDQVPHAVDEGGATLQRTKSVARSVVTVAKASKGLFRLVKV
jgi:MFS family permease